MEQSTPNSMAGLPHSTHGPQTPEYWGNLDYAQLQQPQQSLVQSQTQLQQQQQGQSSQQAPQGITWNHPIFQQQQTQQQQQQQQGIATEQPHIIYSSMNDSWHANPLHQPQPAHQPAHHVAGRNYAVTPSYPPHQQYEQEQMPFDSRVLAPSESSAFPQYPFQQQQYFPQQLAPQSSFTGQLTPQQAIQLQTARFDSSSGFPPGMLSTTIDLTEDFPAPGSSHTIDPHFINPNPLYGSTEYERQPNGRMFDYFQNNISLQPRLDGAQDLMIRKPLPVPHVVIRSTPATKKKPAAKKIDPKKAMNPKIEVESDDSDYSDSDIEAPDELPPIPVGTPRPTEPVAAAENDTFHIVWSPRNKRVPADKFKSALVAFKDIIKTLRDNWKDQVQLMKTAENQGDNDKAATLKQTVSLQRSIMNKIMTTTLEMGHPIIVEKLGEHPMALAAVYSFLADRFQAADYDGSLSLNILKLLARFVSVDQELLQKTNLSKLLPRFAKKGGLVSKDLAQKIIDNAEASTKRKLSGVKSGNDDSPTVGSSGDSVKADTVGLKRPRDGESITQPATKRAVLNSNPKDASKTSLVNGLAKRTIHGTQNGKPAAAAIPRPRPQIVAPKPLSAFGVLAVNKKPGTSNAERAAAAAAAAAVAATSKSAYKEKSAVPQPQPQTQSSFSFGDLLADLDKPKEKVIAKVAEDKPPETEEERKKRLRKEERRKLRVTWRPDDCLEEVRLFTHDPDEELGPTDGRGAGDVKGEGSVLKLHKDMEELEEDDRETIFEDYRPLSDIILDEVMEGNFIKRGGTHMPTSPEKEAQEHRELNSLMVFYASPADVPSTPKEPTAPAIEEIVLDELPFGELPDTIKARQERYFAYMSSKTTIVQPPAQSQATPAAGGFDLSNFLKIMQTGQQSAPPPQPVSTLEQTVNMLRQNQFTQAPQIPAQPAAAPAMDFQGILNIMKQFQQPGAAFPQQPIQSGVTPNLGAIFSQFAGQPQQNGASQSMHHNSSYDDTSRKRVRENTYYDNEYEKESHWSRQTRTRLNDPSAPQPYRTKRLPCMFYNEGRCKKGENCTYRHDV
ncbi:Zinc finger CCCH-type [Penicillium taxi]|uniref:Zinc finger CCCH-type n=1 Tax=Penicillium taxi TaxID=168475 RepID=UPI0025450317|nr:Zinc finger CCCH-type [Penicillium taxi]KAJ5884824.1 Zinc finger CCCH-type [Penicillium taxi]